MALKKNTLSFEQLHKVVVDTIVSKGFIVQRENILKIIGKWYEKFTHSEQTHLSLQLPTFREDEIILICEYVLNLDLLLKILKHEQVSNYQGTALFDIFSYVWSDSFRKKANPTRLSFQRKVNDVLYFDDDTVISEKRFSPIFIASQIDDPEISEAIYDSFFLMRVLAQSALVSHVVLLDLESDLSLFVSKPLLLRNPKLLLESVAISNVRETSQLHEFLDHVKDMPINMAISYRFPYNSAIDSRVYKSLKDDTKRFELILRKRFYYDEIKREDIVITPEELDNELGNISDFFKCFDVIQTDHSSDLFNLLNELKELWRTSGFNPYRVPFPAKWLTCINGSEKLSFWQDQYKKDFPAVKHATLTSIQNVIDIMYSLNWIDQALGSSNHFNIIVPQSRLYTAVINSLSNYFREKDNSIIDFEEMIMNTESENNSVMIFDSFNTIMLTNVAHLSGKINMKVVSPDFIRYNCQPFVKYHIANYKYDAMTKGLRESFDSSHESRIQIIKTEKETMLKEITRELRQYERRFSDLQRDWDDLDLKFNRDDSSSPLIESEVVELVDDKHRNERISTTNFIKVTTANQEFILKVNAKVLIEDKGYILSSEAFVLSEGMRFLPMVDISRVIEKNNVIDRMASMPEKALNWKYLLFLKSKTHTKIFDALKDKDLSIQEGTFNKVYLSEQSGAADDFHLPRGYHDWEIVCEYLNILEVEEAWMCHKCHGNIAALKNAYSRIISFLNEEGNYGANIDDGIVAKVADIFESITLIHEPQEERLKLARSIIQSITNKLELQEIVRIKSLSYEQ